MKQTLISLLALTLGLTAFAHENDKKAAPDRSAKNLGNVLVVGGTGWYQKGGAIGAVKGQVNRRLMNSDC